jgi:hypothetical protein
VWAKSEAGLAFRKFKKAQEIFLRLVRVRQNLAAAELDTPFRDLPNAILCPSLA